jgi:hypothetical protein
MMSDSQGNYKRKRTPESDTPIVTRNTRENCRESIKDHQSKRYPAMSLLRGTSKERKD